MENPLIVMSAITGCPDKAEIYNYLRSIKENGIEQAMLYPRSGCEIEYLSEKWFATIGDFIECAKELGMYIWLYDDFNWPSGDAGGRVTAIPEYRLRAISTKGENPGQISYKSLHNSGLFGEKFFPNLLSYEAVAYFISLTHEEYYKRFGKDFGAVIKGIFTDEPSIGYCSHDDYIPYYDGIEADYFELCGRDFYKDLKTQEENFYFNAISVISKRFRECYINQISNWCKNHGILMTGHLMCDNEPFWTTKHSGELLKNLSHFSLPGIDEIETQLDTRTEMALLGVAEYASGESGAMAELFALGPCDMPYSKKRVMLYLMASFKVDHYFLAISHFDMRGNMLVKDFFSNFSPDQPDFAGMRLLSEDARVAGALAKRDFVPDIYIRYPFSVSAKRITENLDFTPLFDLINTLTYKQIQWKFIDDEMPCDAPIIELNDHLELTMGGEAFEVSSLKVAPIVTDKSGDAPYGIFVRKFDDGGFIVLNLFATGNEYFIDGHSVFLKEHDIYFSSGEAPQYKAIEALPSFSVSYSHDNITRTMHLCDGDITEIHLDCDLEIAFAVRDGVSALLDGEALAYTSDADFLPLGMRKFYLSTQKMLLKKGKHTLCADKDFKYMPSVLIYGDFKCEALCYGAYALRLSERSRRYACGEGICDFGSVEFTTTLDIPLGARGVRLNGTGLFTKVYVNDTLLGEKIASPYNFSLSDDLCGEGAILKIVQYSSLAPIFGRVDFWDKNIGWCSWRGTPSPSGEPFGFSMLEFLF